ncbi:MAG: ComEC/Rec2 family competence protein [Prevotella sp.]|nr:ComEC/Rec2 family competence protein [Prevotella sp.]
MESKSFGDEIPLLRLAICLMVGIVVGDFVVPEWRLLLAIFVMMVIVALLLWKHEHWQSVAIAACFGVLGWLLIERQKAALEVVWPKGEVAYEAVVISEPVEKPKTMAVDVLLAQSGRKLKCYLYKDDRSRDLRIGDGLQIQSRIEANSDWRRGSFDYRRYLEIHGFTGRTFVASWKWRKAKVSLAHLLRLERMRLTFLKYRSQLLSRLHSATVADDDAYAVVAAMALGDKSALTQNLKDVYSVTGASHILALSGLHLGIIYTLLSLFVFRRRWQVASQVFIILSVWTFVFLVGMSTSVMRSAMMLSVYALLSLGHRDRMSVNTLAFTAIVMLMISPMALFDVGFQMSYLAVLSILLFIPLMEHVFTAEYLMSHRMVRWLWGMVAVSLSAQIGTAPLIAYYFGRFSCYFLLTNFIVIPAAMLILYLSFIVFLIPSLAYILFNIVAALNSLLAKIAMIPGASIDNLHPTKIQTTMIYMIIVAVYLLAVKLTCIRASARYR